jgi:hypothetical protein
MNVRKFSQPKRKARRKRALKRRRPQLLIIQLESRRLSTSGRQSS